MFPNQQHEQAKITNLLTLGHFYVTAILNFVWSSKIIKPFIMKYLYKITQARLARKYAV